MKTTLYEAPSGQKFILVETRSKNGAPSFTVYRKLSDREFNSYKKVRLGEICMDSLEHRYWLRFFVADCMKHVVSHLLIVVGQVGYNNGVPYSGISPLLFPVIYPDREAAAQAEGSNGGCLPHR